jgi:hypothetical protein
LTDVLDLDIFQPGVEAEDIDIETIVDPFDPTLIRIKTLQPSIDLLLSRIRHHELDLAPDFQRAGGIWDDKKQSRLIESILIRIPLPAFYMVATENETWQVVDGLQRLTTLKRFAIDEALALRDMEFLTALDSFRFSALPRNFQRRILETQVTVYLIEEGTPDAVKFNIFRRINTGGVPLNAQEIRHALNQGPITKLLTDLTTSKEFKTATNDSIRPDRMDDRECAIRFIAFVLTPYYEYKAKDFDGFLSDAMKKVNKMTDQERAALKVRFLRTMQIANELFGIYAFRKYSSSRMMPINKPLFEAWSVNLDRLNDLEIKRLIDRREHLNREYEPLLFDPNFDGAISFATGNISKIRIRFESIERLIRRVIA